MTVGRRLGCWNAAADLLSRDLQWRPVSGRTRQMLDSLARLRFVFAVSSAASPVARHFRDLAGHLAESGDGVLLLTKGDPASPLHSGVSIEEWPSERPTHLRDVRFALSVIGDVRPHLVMGHFGSVNVVTIAAWIKRVPVRMVWHHTLSDQLSIDSGATCTKSRMLILRKRTVLRLANVFGTNSEAGRDDLMKTYGIPHQKIHIQPYTMTDPALEPKKVQRFFLLPGRLVESKGHRFVLEALAELRSQGLQLPVRIVGEGPSGDQLVELARVLGVESQCRFTGGMAHDQLLQEMSSAWATLVPSQAEAFGMVNVESLAVGTPVIASAVGGIPDIIRSGREGFLVEPGDSHALAEAMRRLWEDENLRGTMSAAARRRFLRHYESRRVIPYQAAWLRELIGSASGSKF